MLNDHVSDNASNRGYDFVVIAPEFTFVIDGQMATPCYLRPVTDRANDFVNMAYAMHKRGLGNSLVFTRPELFEQALQALSALGLAWEVL